MTGPVSGRFHTLDAMRGLAAILVAAYHIGQTFPQSYAPRGYLAVDFFFLLSGFVVAHAYEGRLKDALSFRDFVILRIVRLYPLFFLGLALGGLGYALKMLVGSDSAPALGRFLLWWPTNLLMLPSINTPALFPLNGPSWSLMFEVLINLAYAALLFRMPTPVLLLVAAASAVGMALGSALAGTLNLGWGWENAAVGLARVGFSFSLGVAMFRMGVGRRRVRSWAAALPILILCLVLILPADPALAGILDPLIVVLLFPVLLIFAARLEAPRALERPAALLGDLSYPFYATHSPLMTFFMIPARALTGSQPLYTTAFIVLSLAAAYLALHYYDAPMRRAISRRLKRRVSAPPELAG